MDTTTHKRINPYNMHYIDTIRQQKPLIHHITNWVTIYDLAQITRSIGALPVMAHAADEVADMVALAGALVLNIGTLTPELIQSMVMAGKAANKKGIPVVLDAVGAGATPMRTAAIKQLLTEINVRILKGNAGEIAVLAGTSAEVRGVESIGEVEGIEALAQALATRENAVVVVTGKEDIIADKTQVKTLVVGHEIMGRVVGTGCMAGSVLGCFAAVAPDLFDGCVAAMEHYGNVGERVAQTATGPMNWKINMLDELAK